ncbi:element excision factor XisI family protein, partial [Coleofasciculus sp. F4-SAH-05]
MDKLEQYRQAVQQVLTKYGSYKPINVQIEVQTIFDTERNHYQVVSVG